MAIAIPVPLARWRSLRAIIPGVVLGLAVAATIYLISVPLAMLLLTAFRGPSDLLPFEPGAHFTLSHFTSIYADPILYEVIVPDTIVFTAGSVAAGFLIAFVLAWLVERTDIPWREGLFTLILVPLLVPNLVLAIAWILLLGSNTGWLNVLFRSLFGFSSPGPLNIFSMPGLILAQALALVPFVFLLLCAALRSMDTSLEEASSVAGARPTTTFFRVTFPVLRPGILAPAVLGSIITLEQFEIPLLIGMPARINVFSTRIFWELNPASGLPNYGRAAAVSLPFLLAALALLLLYNRMIQRADRFVTITGRGFQPRRMGLGSWRWAAFAAVLAYVMLSAALPAFVLFWGSLFGLSAPSFGSLSNISFGGYSRLLSDPKLYLALKNTIMVASLSALIVTLIGALLAWIVVRTKMVGRSVLDFISMMSVGIPSIIAALAVMILYLTFPVGMYGTIWILVVAYSYRLAVTTRISRAALMQLHHELEDASYVAGGAWWTTLRRVVLPLLAPSLAGAWLLLFIIGVREFTLPMVLHSPDNIVLSVILWRLFADGETMQASALATMVLFLVVGVTVAVRRLFLPRVRGF